MNMEQFEQQALDYLKGKLDKKEEKAFLALMDNNADKKQHFEELNQIWNAMNSVSIETPDESLRNGFYNMLALHQLEDKKLKSLPQRLEMFLEKLFQYKRIGQLAMAVSIALVSGYIGYQSNAKSVQQELHFYTQEVEHLNTELVAVQLKSASTSDRIHAVNSLRTINLKEAEIVKKLSNKLLYDDNLHVRIAAGKSLLAFDTNSKVKPVIIKAIRTEKELLVQATLIDILITLDKEAAIKEIYKMYDSEYSSLELKTIYKSILESKSI